MSKVLLGMVTFGNIDFTRMAVNSVLETTTHQIDVFIVVGKPGDTDTINWLASNPHIKYVVHDKNYGFPKSVNDIYDFTWVNNDYDYLILAGNDIIAYPTSVDSLIELADETDYTCISSLQYDVKDLIKDYPDAEKFFSGDKAIFTDFSSRPWDLFTGHSGERSVADMQLFDIQNLCLYKKDVFDSIGYTDVSFFPAYFVDNDYARRIVISGLRCCTLASSRFFHFWSRTIHQGSGGSTDKYFKNNRDYYRSKWGGDFGKERNSPPYKIEDRLLEEQIIESWRKR